MLHKSSNYGLYPAHCNYIFLLYIFYCLLLYIIYIIVYYFIVYILLYIYIFIYIYYWSWSYSCPNFPPLPPSTWYSHSLQLSPHPLVNVLGQACKFFGFSISYTVLNRVYFVPTNLCFLIPALFPPFFPVLLPTDNPPNNLHIYDSVPFLVFA